MSEHLTPRRPHLVSVAGHPWGVAQPIRATFTIRASADLSVYDPGAVLRAELIDRDRLTILETVEAGDITNEAVGVYTAEFAAVDAAGTYYTRLVWTVVAGIGEPEVVWAERLVVESLTKIPVVGVMSVDEMLAAYLGSFPGEPPARALLRGDDGAQLLSDEALAQAITDQASYVERYLNVSLCLKRYAARPDTVRNGGTPLTRGIDFDEETEPLHFDHTHTGTMHGHLVLPHVHVQRITRARILYGRTVLWDLPPRWFQVSRRAGSAYVVIDSTDLDNTGEGITFSAIYAILNAWLASSNHRIPAAWALDYEAGLPDLSQHQDLRAIVGWRAAAQVLSLAAVKANKMQVTSQSTGKDGLSRSISVGDSGPAGRFGRLLDSQIIKDWTSNETLDRIRQQLRPGIRLY